MTVSSPLKDKRIVLGVSGGIAAFKAVELLRLLVREGASVFVAMTPNARKFITPLTFQALSGHPVYQDVFQPDDSDSMEHIRSAENSDLLVIAPATANAIGKLANGLADDALSTLFAAYKKPVLVAPAMNENMWTQPAVQGNIEKLRCRGVQIVEPEQGPLACGMVGEGRLAEPVKLLEAIKKRLAKTRDLDGIRFLVTAGPTREPIDPVRYITNPSSGKMGYAVAQSARDRGAEVTLISGPTSLPQPVGMNFVPCQRTNEMCALVLDHLPHCDVVVMTAAVGDFASPSIHKEKIKKTFSGELNLKLVRTQDILQEIARVNRSKIVVGFAAETENLVQSALEKLRNKKLDLMVANDISAPGIGFQSDFNQVTLIQNENDIERLPRLSKVEIADILLDRILKLVGENRL